MLTTYSLALLSLEGSFRTVSRETGQTVLTLSAAFPSEESANGEWQDVTVSLTDRTLRARNVAGAETRLRNRYKLESMSDVRDDDGAVDPTVLADRTHRSVVSQERKARIEAFTSGPRKIEKPGTARGNMSVTGSLGDAMVLRPIATERKLGPQRRVEKVARKLRHLRSPKAAEAWAEVVAAKAELVSSLNARTDALAAAGMVGGTLRDDAVLVAARDRVEAARTAYAEAQGGYWLAQLGV